MKKRNYKKYKVLWVSEKTHKKMMLVGARMNKTVDQVINMLLKK